MDNERDKLRDTLSKPGVEGPPGGAGEARADDTSDGAGDASRRRFFRLIASAGTVERSQLLTIDRVHT